jgi:hypothetical protein
MGRMNSGGKPKFALYEDQKASGTDGGSSIAGTQTRTLNTEVHDDIGGTLSSNAVTLPAGDYLVEARAPARNVGLHRIELYDGTSIIAEGSASYGSTSENVISESFLRTKITADGVKAYSIRHYTASARATYGLGSNVGTGTNSIYTQLKFTKL